MNLSHYLTRYFTAATLVLVTSSIGAKPTEQQPHCFGEAAVDKNGQLIHTEKVIPQNPHNPILPASTVKLLTAALSLKYLKNLEDTVTYFRPRAENKKKDDELCRAANEHDNPKRFIKISTTIEKLIIAMLLASDNDAAIKLQELIEHTTRKPYKMIASEYTRSIGLENTHLFEGAGISNISFCSGMKDVNYKTSVLILTDLKNRPPINISTSYDMAVLAGHITAIPKIQEYLRIFKPKNTRAPKPFPLKNGPAMDKRS